MLFRKILILGVILFLILSTVGTGITKEVSHYRARTVAQNWLHHLTESHGFGHPEFIPPEVKIIDEEVMVYENRVVGYNFILSPRGHIIVPFRDELPPVKLYSDTTTLRMADDSDVAEWIREELFKIYEALDSRKQEFASIDFSSTPNGRLWALFDVDSSSFPNEYLSATTGMEFLSIGPLLSTTWAQGDPYNIYCPLWNATPYVGVRTVTGCVATAAAQIMKYWNYPASGQGSTSYTWYDGSTNVTLSANFSSSTYQWSSMKNSYSSGGTTAEKEAVARLMSDIGIAFHMNYGVGASGANTMDGTTVYPTYFKYKSTISAVYRTSYASDSAWMKVFRDEVQNNRPSQLRIKDPDAGGHSVVVDGYRDSPSEQIHINLGWSGNYNGWYLPSNIEGGGYYFTDVDYQAALIGIEPESGPGPTGFYTMNSNATYSYIADADQFINSWVGNADDGYYELSLAGFDFQFYGTSVTSVRISTNGYITFGTTGSAASNVSIPDVNQPNAIIAPFWDDLNATGLTSPPGVWWKFYGTAPNRYLVIEWYQVPRYGNPSATYSFEIVLYESSDRIKFQYLDVDYDFGSSATVGIENFDGTVGLQFSYNTASLSNGKAIEFIPKLSGIADFNGDVKSDILWQHTDGTLAIWFMDGTTVSAGSGGFGWGPSAWQIKGLGDFNGDSKSDILWRHTDGTLALWFMDGTTVSAGSGGFGWVASAWQNKGVGDFNGDSKSDILWQHTDGTLALWFMNGTSVLPASGGVAMVPSAWQIKGVGDFNGDSKADILWRHTDGTLAIWFMDGTTISAGSGGFGWAPSAWQIKNVGDFNGDSKSDILWQHTDGTLALWFMNGTTVGAGSGGFGWVSSAWQIKGVGDFNGDSKSDILWRHTDGTLALWFMNGTTVSAGSGGFGWVSSAWQIKN